MFEKENQSHQKCGKIFWTSIRHRFTKQVKDMDFSHIKVTHDKSTMVPAGKPRINNSIRITFLGNGNSDNPELKLFNFSSFSMTILKIYRVEESL